MKKYFDIVKNGPKDTILPTKGSELSAGYDCYSPIDFSLIPGAKSDRIALNIKAVLPKGYYVKLENRSGLRDRDIILWCGGVVDADYANNPKNDGNIMIRLFNFGTETFYCKKGDRICQAIVHRYYDMDDNSCTEQRVGGFGSTGK